MLIRFRPWVVWWFCLGVIGGVVALVNIFFMDLTRTEERVILFLGVVHWLLGALVCWAWESVKLERNHPIRYAAARTVTDVGQESGRNVAFQHYGQMSPRRSSVPHETLTTYLLRHWEHEHKE